MVGEIRGSPVVVLAELLDQTVRARLVVETEVAAEVTLEVEVEVEVGVMDQRGVVEAIPAARTSAEALATPQVVHLEMAALAEQVQPTRLPRRERDDRARGGCVSAGTTIERERRSDGSQAGNGWSMACRTVMGFWGVSAGVQWGLICYGEWISLCSISLLV
jgi:hypothetical protein